MRFFFTIRPSLDSLIMIHSKRRNDIRFRVIFQGTILSIQEPDDRNNDLFARSAENITGSRGKEKQQLSSAVAQTVLWHDNWLGNYETNRAAKMPRKIYSYSQSVFVHRYVDE